MDQLKERNKLLVPLEDDAKLTQELYAEEKRSKNNYFEIGVFSF